MAAVCICYIAVLGFSAYKGASTYLTCFNRKLVMRPRIRFGGMESASLQRKLYPQPQQNTPRPETRNLRARASWDVRTGAPCVMAMDVAYMKSLAGALGHISCLSRCQA